MKKLLTFIIPFLLFPSVLMAQGLPLKDGNSSSLADIQACGAENCVRATGPTTSSGAGYGGLVGISGDNAVTSGTKRFNPILGTEGGGLRMGVSNLMWDDTFNGTAQNTSKYRFVATTMTGSQSGGYVNINSGAITTINTNAAYQSTIVFPFFGKQEIRTNISAKITVAPQANAVTEWGLFTATLPGGAAPLDGCFFRFNAVAEFRGVCNYNGTETQTAAITTPSANVNHDYLLVIQTNTVIFYVDGAVSGTITLSTDAPALGQPTSQATLPITFRHYIGGSAPASGMQFQVSDVFVTSLGPDLARDWGTQKSGFGHVAAQGQNGGTMGTTALYTNSLAPGAGAAMTNTTAALGVGLGGQFAALPTLTANTDGIMQSFQNPVGSVTQTPRNLIINGVWVKGMVTTLIAGGPIYYFYSLAYGHTAVSMATAETASFVSPSTKAPRRIPLGIETFPVSAPTGTLGQGVYIQFPTPIVIAPGEFVAICAKNVGTVSSAGVVTWITGYNGYFE